MDVTPAALRGGVLYRGGVVMDAAGRIHVALRHTRGQMDPEGLYAFTFDAAGPSPVVALAAPGQLGPGDVQLVHDPHQQQVIALWRGADGVYRSATRGG